MKGLMIVALLALLGCGSYPLSQHVESEAGRAACEQVCREHGADAFAYMETRTHRICQCFRQGPNQTTPGRGILL